MASDALISAVVDQLISYAQQQVTLVTGAREEVGKLTVSLKIIQGVVAHAEEKQVKHSGVKVWLAELKEVIYAVDDVLDEWHTKTALSQLQEGVVDPGSTRKKVLSLLLPLCHCFKHVSVRYDIGRQIKEIRERLDVIANERIQYGLDASNSHNEPTSITPLTCSVFDVSEIRGRDGDKQVIIDMLLGESESSGQGLESIRVISIVGTGGFGKTTLARLVLQEKRVENAFEMRLWVCVSQPFDLSGIVKEVVEQATGGVPNFHGLEAMHQHLSNSVKGKRFLLILDDVWTKDPQDWDPLKHSLSVGASGSRILVTTRNKEVATMMGSTHIRDLGVLSEEDSWSLLSHVALKGREQEHQKFEKIGREIAFKCKGVPLAIQTLARSLCDRRSIQDWRNVANSNLWEISHIKDFFLPSLFISYYSLPPISKLCFLYCSVFPKDTDIIKSKLVELWMAQGFFGYGGNRDLERDGEYHFDILAMRSFFQDFEINSDGKIVRCKMHDLVHDFAQFLSQGESINGEGNDSEFDVKRLRHLWTKNPSGSSIYELKNLRTLMNAGPDIQSYDKLLCLRTLDLSWSGLEELPGGISKLLHLRYLDLSHTSLSGLPETICNLLNLQTLKLYCCESLCKLPDRIGDLSSLRHLDIGVTSSLIYFPRGVNRLIFLRELSKFIVGDLNDQCKVGDLVHLKKLQGSLSIAGLERVTDANEATQAGLNEKKALDKLELEWTRSRIVGTSQQDLVQISTMSTSVLERLEPPEYLKELTIRGYSGDQFPSWMHDSSSVLSNLVYMELSGCVNCTQLPTLGKLGSLERLHLNQLNSVKCVGPEFFGANGDVVLFPKQEELSIANMKELEQWKIPHFSQEDTSRIKIMPSLCKLTIKYCPKLRVLPDMSKFNSLETLRLSGLPKWEGEEEGEEREEFISSLKSLSIWGCGKLKVIPTLGKLGSLERLHLEYLDSVKCVGPEFFGANGDGVLFPKLEELSIKNMEELEQWKIPHFSQEDTSRIKIMPSLCDLTITDCPKLRVLPDMSKFNSLETLRLFRLPKWEGEEEGEEREEFIRLKSLFIFGCSKLKVIPHSMFSHTLRELSIVHCPGLRGNQPYLPPLLEKLTLSGDVGVFSESLPLNNQFPSSINFFHLSGSPHSSPPKGFNQFKLLQTLELCACISLSFDPKDLQQFTMLKYLYIKSCPLLEDRVRIEGWKKLEPPVDYSSRGQYIVPKL